MTSGGALVGGVGGLGVVTLGGTAVVVVVVVVGIRAWHPVVMSYEATQAVQRDQAS